MSISSTLNVQIFYTNVVSAAFSSCMYVVKAAETTFVRKNVDEIDTRIVGTFHSYFHTIAFTAIFMHSKFYGTLSVKN